MTIVEVPLSQIRIGDRRRQDFGDIDGLMKGMQRVGLLEPIVVSRNGGEDHYRLVAGERRLRAAWHLGWETISAQLREQLSEAELRDIELEENLNRKSLTEAERTRTFESSRRLIENAKRAGRVISSAAEEKDARGRKAALGAPKEEIAEALDIGVASLVRAEQHVETAQQFSFMQSGTWRQSDVLRIRERIAELPEEERDSAAGVLGCAKLMDPELAVQLMENLGAKKPEDRQEIYELSRSTDPRDQSLALTKTAELPPMPDPRLGVLDNVLRFLHAAIKPYPKDPLTARLIQVRAEIQSIRAAVKEVSYDARRQKEAAIQ
jgi:ParB-like chromosome segregation protein Spo0J